MGSCPICALPFDGHQPCAVCDVSFGDATVSHWRRCEFCKNDKANDDWSREERTGKIGLDEDAALLEVSAAAPVFETRARRVTPLQAQITQALIIGIETRIRYRDPRRCRPVERRWWRTPSNREIARRVGCSHTYVAKVIRKR